MGWEVNGVKGAGNRPPPFANNFRGATLLVVGSGRSLWDDLARAPQCTHTLCVNFAGAHFPRPFEHWASLHPDYLAHWKYIRERERPQGHIWTHGHRPSDGVEFVWDLEVGPGCSGLFAAYIGVAMGYERVVLAGVPEDGNGHFYDPPGNPGTYSNAGARGQWEYARDVVFVGRVKSLSGLTRDLLGAP